MPPSKSIDEVEIDELELLLAEVNSEKVSKNVTPKLREDESFAKAFEIATVSPTKKVITRAPPLLEKDIDSSDDEDIGNFLERKYNEYGRGIDKKIKQDRVELKESQVTKEINQSLNKSENLFSKNKPRVSLTSIPPPARPASLIPAHIKRSGNARPESSLKSSNSMEFKMNELHKNTHSSAVFLDPIFGMRIINPLISSSVLIERMDGKKAVSMASIDFHINHTDLSKDWVVSGAIVSKSPVKISKNRANYSIWKLSDLKGQIKTISLFLFKNAHNELYKTSVGTVVAILNPKIFEKLEDRNDAACLTIDNATKVMLLGQSKDIGTCRAKKKNGENCTSIVNLTDCEFCIYHVKQEFGKMSKRSELQSSTAGRGLQELRNKVLGKSEVFYGGQSFTAVLAKKSVKLVAQDQQRMMTLSEYFNSPNAGDINHASNSSKTNTPVPYVPGSKSKIVNSTEITSSQKLKDLKRLHLLKEEEERFKSESESTSKSSNSVISPNVPSDESEKSSLFERTKTVNQLNVKPSVSSEKQKTIEFSFSKKPTLSLETFSIDLNVDVKKAAGAKFKALEILKKKPIEKSNPNFIKYRGTSAGKRRVMDEWNDDFNNESKRKKVEDSKKEQERKSRIQKMIDASSSNAHLVEMRFNEEQEAYFNKLERKEAMEEKMLNTFKISCKAVICLTCKYTSFSAADRCKGEKHPLKVIDAEKRFFQCEDCGNRTVTLHKLPKTSCKNCSSSKWKRAAMIREKNDNSKPQLSIRGDEETFIGSLAASANLNLLLPDED